MAPFCCKQRHRTNVRHPFPSSIVIERVFSERVPTGVSQRENICHVGAHDLFYLFRLYSCSTSWRSGQAECLFFFFFFFLSHSLLPAVDLQNRSMSFGQASARVNHFRIYCLVHNASLQSLFVCPVNCGGPANVGQSTGAGQTRQWALCRSFDLFFFFSPSSFFSFLPFFSSTVCV